MWDTPIEEECHCGRVASHTYIFPDNRKIRVCGICFEALKEEPK